MKAFLDYASAKYYAGEPIISDEEFDKLAEYHGYESVGAPVVGDRTAHAFPLYSLQKCYDDEPLTALPGFTVTTPKIDGAAVALYYAYGTLALALTRGDGKEGLDITEKMKQLVPNQLPNVTTPLLQITGEVAAPSTIENARNYAAGALNLKSLEEFASRQITFIAYGMKPYKYDCWSQDMGFLHDLDFNTVLDSEWEDYPQDGKVYRLDDYEKFDELGYTSKHPRGAFALKERKGGVITKLLDVVWQVGRSGVITPVALLEPVNIEGATISRATLNNINYIKELNLEIGCLVTVQRAGSIIPKIVGRVYAEKENS
jgi:NAD-dependent DNA ligase